MKFATLLAVLICFATKINAQCNGFDFLCDRSYKDVSYLTTHNAFCAEDQNFFGPNQSFGLAQQLEDGVRAMMLDVYIHNGEVTLYHAESFLGTKPLAEDLQIIKNFLDDNSNEVVTLIFESYVSDSSLNAVMEDVGLVPYCYTYDAAAGWPTLQEMIDVNQRLVVMSDNVDPGVAPAWYHYMWDIAVETDFANKDTADFSCDFNRGEPENDLFILNHFNTSEQGGLGDTAKTEIANANPYFINRANECWDETGKLPNFVTVDFYERGSCIEVVNELNASNPVGLESLENEPKGLFNIYPNPSNNILHINVLENSSMAENLNLQVIIYDAAGRLCMRETLDSVSNTMDVKSLNSGLFYMEVSQKGQVIHRSKVIKS